jgi:hypothetical protein
MKDENPYRWFGGNATQRRAEPTERPNRWLVLIGLAYPAFTFLALTVTVRLASAARIPSYGQYLTFAYFVPGAILVAVAALRLACAPFTRCALLAFAGWVLVVAWFFRAFIQAVWATI